MKGMQTVELLNNENKIGIHYLDSSVGRSC